MVGIDFSPASDNALREAERIARWKGARLLAFHVVDDEELAHWKGREGFDQDSLAAQIRRRLLEHAGSVVTDPGVLDAEVRIGHPLTELLRALEDHDCHYLALGSQGEECPEDRVGPLASQCLRKAPATVFLARAWSGKPYAKVTACVDLSATSTKALEEAASIALQDQASLEIIYVVRPVTATYGDFATPAGLGMFEINLPPFPDLDPVKQGEEQIQALLGPLRERLDSLDIQTHVVEAMRPASAITDRLIETGSDLVVLGTRGRTGLKALLLGTTAERILKHAPCSAIAVKPDEFSYQID